MGDAGRWMKRLSCRSGFTPRSFDELSFKYQSKVGPEIRFIA